MAEAQAAADRQEKTIRDIFLEADAAAGNDPEWLEDPTLCSVYMPGGFYVPGHCALFIRLNGEWREDNVGDKPVMFDAFFNEVGLSWLLDDRSAIYDVRLEADMRQFPGFGGPMTLEAKATGGDTLKDVIGKLSDDLKEKLSSVRTMLEEGEEKGLSDFERLPSRRRSEEEERALERERERAYGGLEAAILRVLRGEA